MEQKESTITLSSEDKISVPVEPKVFVPEGLVFYYQGKKVGSADFTVDMTNIPEGLHQFAISIASTMRHNFHLDGALVSPPPPIATTKKSWKDRLPWKRKKTQGRF